MIQSVERAANILKALGGGSRRLGVSELSDQLGLAKGTVHGLLRTLEAHGLVEQDPAFKKIVKQLDTATRAGAGTAQQVALIRQGQKILSFYRNGEKTDMVSPTEGEVMAINAAVVENPALMRQEPYGKGWLLSVHVPDEENTTRNLVPKMLVGEWMREAVERLYARQPNLAGAVAADGGRPADDLLEALPDHDWQEVTGEFFLTK